MNALRYGFAKLKDPRYYQIAVLSLLLSYGILGLDFGIRAHNAAAVFSVALLTQFIATRALGLSSGLARFDPLSPLITSLSLTLLLRTDAVWLAALAAVIAIGSKFVLRVKGKHIFNPANFALVTLMLLSDQAWVSSGQWGNAAIVSFTLASLGLIVITRAKRAETTFAFIVVYAALIFGRAIWLGDPMSIPMHQLQNGALLIFAFFMISDPRTSPNTALGRCLFATLVATLAFTIQFIYYQPNGPILALIMVAPLVPLIDAVFKGFSYRWNSHADKSTGAITGA